MREEIHKRLMGFRQPAFFIIQRATSSPSRPASVAMMRSSISGIFIRFFTTPNCFEVSFITTKSILAGSIGRSSIFHVLYLSSYNSGSASVTKCPKAQTTMYFDPIKHPLPFWLQFKIFAISRPTEGFSVNTNVFPISYFPSFIVSFTCPSGINYSLIISPF